MRRMRLAAWVAGAAMLWSVPMGVDAAAVPAAAPAAVPIAQGIKGTYAQPIVRVDDAQVRHVDTPATIARLQALGANTYAFAVRNQQEWEDLGREFLPAAQQAGIKVWAYLLPPSECPSRAEPTDESCDLYFPHQKNYTLWARDIALLSRQYPVLTAWALDDFNGNTDYFTPARLSELRRTTAAIEPNLHFYPVVYVDAVDKPFVDSYAHLIDGVITPYRDGLARNTFWTAALRPQLDRAIALLNARGRKAILMPFAKGVSTAAVPPDIEYVRTVTAIGMQYTRTNAIAGVIQYSLPLTPGKSFAKELAHPPGNGVLAFSIDHSPTTAGAFAEATTEVRLNEGSTTCSLKFWHTDDWGTTAPAGYHRKQALVNGSVVWTRDVASDAAETWYTAAPIDLSPQLSTGRARLAFRLYEAQAVSNYWVLARIDDIQLTGCHIANPTLEKVGGWAFTRNHDRVLAGQWIHDPVYPTTVFTVVSALYAAS